MVPLAELAVKLIPSFGLTKIMLSGKTLLMSGGCAPAT